MHAHTIKKRLTYCNYGTKSSLSRHKSHIKPDPGQDKPSVERRKVKSEFRLGIRADNTSVSPAILLCQQNEVSLSTNRSISHTAGSVHTFSANPSVAARRALPPGRRMLHSLRPAPIILGRPPVKRLSMALHRKADHLFKRISPPFGCARWNGVFIIVLTVSPCLLNLHIKDK